MTDVYMYLAEGFEEVEAIAPLDILRRAGISVQTVSISGDLIVKGSHNIEIVADILFADSNLQDVKMLILPGGGVGTANLAAYQPLTQLIQDFANTGKYVAAICAAPTILGNLGLLDNKTAVCYPSMQSELQANHGTSAVVVDSNIITSKAMGTAIDFGLTLVGLLKGNETAEEIRESIVYGN